MVLFRKWTQTNMTLGRANNMDMLFFHKPIKKCMSKTASVLDTGTSGSTPVGYHDLPWPSGASGTVEGAIARTRSPATRVAGERVRANVFPGERVRANVFPGERVAGERVRMSVDCSGFRRVRLGTPGSG